MEAKRENAAVHAMKYVLTNGRGLPPGWRALTSADVRLGSMAAARARRKYSMYKNGTAPVDDSDDDIGSLQGDTRQAVSTRRTSRSTQA